jgi:hypothetical protein
VQEPTAPESAALKELDGVEFAAYEPTALRDMAIQMYIHEENKKWKEKVAEHRAQKEKERRSKLSLKEILEEFRAKQAEKELRAEYYAQKEELERKQVEEEWDLWDEYQKKRSAIVFKNSEAVFETVSDEEAAVLGLIPQVSASGPDSNE